MQRQSIEWDGSVQKLFQTDLKTLFTKLDVSILRKIHHKVSILPVNYVQPTPQPPRMQGVLVTLKKMKHSDVFSF